MKLLLQGYNLKRDIRSVNAQSFVSIEETEQQTLSNIFPIVLRTEGILFQIHDVALWFGIYLIVKKMLLVYVLI